MSWTLGDWFAEGCEDGYLGRGAHPPTRGSQRVRDAYEDGYLFGVGQRQEDERRAGAAARPLSSAVDTRGGGDDE